MHYGSTEIGQVFYGSTEIGEAWTHDGAWRQVFTAVGPIIATRVDKTVTQTMTQSVWGPVTWDAGSGDPHASGAVTVSGAGQATIAATAAHNILATGAFRITVNGDTIVALDITPLIPSTSLAISGVRLNRGDLVRLEARIAQASATYRAVLKGTFMTITAA